MAFTSASLAAINVSNDPSGSVFKYKSADLLAVITASAYFSTADAVEGNVPSKGTQMGIYDDTIILVQAGDGLAIIRINVTSGGVASTDTIWSQGSNIESLTAAKTLTAADNGKTFVLEALAGVAITLPDAANGLKYKFMNGEITTTSNGHVISATDDDGNNIKGVVTTNGALNATTGADVITFTSTVALAGDYFEIESDGVNWYVSGQGSAATSIAFS